MSDVFVYMAELPPKVREMVASGPDGFSVYIDSRLDEQARLRAYKHALKHIERGDHQRDDVQMIEAEAHKKEV